MTAAILALAVLVVVALAGAIAFGGPREPTAPLASVNDPFARVDFSDLPPLRRWTATDGVTLAYRDYAPAGEPVGSVTLIHGSSASSESMHPLAKALAAAGLRVLSLDVRGHGASGTKGHGDRAGRLEDDLADFVRSVRPPAPSTLLGFSLGGGFVVRVASGPHRALFDGWVLLAPFLGRDAPNSRPEGGAWAQVGLPRLIAVSVLDRLGIRAFHDLPVIRFALGERAKAMLTPAYDYTLATEFGAPRDWRAALRAVDRPVALVAGTADELLDSSALAALVRDAGHDWPVEVLPDLGHITLILEPAGHAATVRAIRRVQSAR